MKVVLDTNVLVSGLLSAQGPCGQILELVLDGALQPCIDGRIFEEHTSVLQRPKLAIAAEDASEILGLIRLVAEPIAPMPLGAKLPDASDRSFLEVAATAQAILVTGNKRHFPKSQCKGVQVVSPREFLDILSEMEP